MKICSLIPGATEIVAALGMAQNLVGISHECDYPPSVQGVPTMVRPRIESRLLTSDQIDAQVATLLASGDSLYELDETGLRAAAPDLIITQDLCDVCAVTPSQLQRIRATLSPVPQLITLAPHRLSDILHDVLRVGLVLGREAEAERFVTQLRERLDAVGGIVSSSSSPRPPIGAATHTRVACLEWLSPLYAAGHWVPDMVEAAGGREVLAVAGQSSPRITWDQLWQADPDVIVLMPCGFTIARTTAELSALTDQPQWNSLRAVRERQVYVVDALSYFSRPGPRLVEGVEILANVLRPESMSSRSAGTAVRLEPVMPHSSNS
jgi:iron complex transport system substrate-binding protein